MSRRRNLKTPPPTKSFWQRYQWYIMAGVALFFVVAVVIPALSAEPVADNGSQSNTTPGPTRPSGVTGELNFPASPTNGRDHIPSGTSAPTYSTDPPTSGPHWSQPGVAPINWGIYDQPIRDEILVHNLEHGGIIIHYRLGVTDDSTVQQLAEFIQNQQGYPEGFILAPRNNHPFNISMSAWEYYLPLFQVNEQLMRSFISAHYDDAPEALTGGPK